MSHLVDLVVMRVEHVQRSMLDSAGALHARCADACKELPTILSQSLTQGICADEAESLRRSVVGNMPCHQIRGLGLSSLADLCQQNTGKSLEAFLAQVCAVLWAPPFWRQGICSHGFSCGIATGNTGILTASPSNLLTEPHLGCCRLDDSFCDSFVNQ
jgi:hypothetical protein